MSTIPITPEVADEPWVLPDKGTVGMACLIVAESAIFLIFVVAYIFYMGQSLGGPTPQQVLELPIFTTICLLSSSLTLHWAVAALRKNKAGAFTTWLAATFALGTIFIVGTGMEWHHLIYVDGLTIRTNLFGTTFYSLVGLHATHVIVGLVMLLAALVFALTGHVKQEHAHRMDVISLYWHFVDAVWVVVFTVVYVLGR
jgi:cytochrome c oxidase subunit 3/cytochrome o ubiquinol oxidase subunit 3